MARRNGGFIGTDGLDAPDPPTGVTPTAGSESVSVAFTAPTDVGTSAITGFVAQVSINDTAYSAGSNTGTSSPIVVSSLTNGTAATAKVWAINAYGTSAPSTASDSFTPSARRGIFAGYFTGVDANNIIQRIFINSSGNSVDFGDLTVARYSGAGMSSATRAVFGGGNDRSANNRSNHIDYITIASDGNAQDFGDLETETSNTTGCSNGTIGAIIGGNTSSGSSGNPENKMQTITIASAGNASDSADLESNFERQGACANTTYGIYAGGNVANNTNQNQIGRFVWSSLGTSVDFGNLQESKRGPGAAASATRAVFAAGLAGSASVTIGYVTIATQGNATDFGDTIQSGECSGTSDKITAVFHWANAVPFDSITIASTGNAVDFGDSLEEYAAGGTPMSASDSHGGIA